MGHSFILVRFSNVSNTSGGCVSSSPLGVPAQSASSTAAPLSPSPNPLSPAKRALVAFLVLLGVALSVAKALLWSRGVWNAEVSGYAIGALFMSSVVAYLIAGRKKNRKPVLFGLIFVGISFVLCLLELSNHPKDPKAEVADLVREASGARPIDRRGKFDSPLDKLLREVMTEALDKAKAHREKAHELEGSLQTLYTPESFSGTEAMSRASDGVQKVTALDHEFALQLEQWPSRVQEQVAQSALSESDKHAFQEGFHDSFSTSELVTLRQQGDQIEAQWCKDTLALYDFARLHAGRIHVKDAHILIEDENVRTRFNELLHQSRGQHQRMKETNAQIAKLQKDDLQKFGLTRKDVGLVEPPESASK
jgi:hypothetical protein